MTYPAVKVKVKVKDYHDYRAYVRAIQEQFTCTTDDAERALGFALDAAREQFWESWKETIETPDPDGSLYFPGFANLKLSREGRSGGWLVVHGLPDVEDWDAREDEEGGSLPVHEGLTAEWQRFEADVTASMDDFRNLDDLLGAIEVNRWAEPNSERYNFICRKDGTVATVGELKAAERAARDTFMQGSAE